MDFKLDNNITESIEEVLDCRIEEKRKLEHLELRMRQDPMVLHEPALESSLFPNRAEIESNDHQNQEILCLTMKKVEETASSSVFTSDNIEKTPKKRRKKREGKVKKIRISQLKHLKHDIRKAPADAKLSQHDEIDDQTQPEINPLSPLNENIMDEEKFDVDNNPDDVDDEQLEDDSNCRDCNVKHNKNECQIHEPLDFIIDTVKFSDWFELNKQFIEEEKPQFDNSLQIKTEDLEEDDDNEIDHENEVDNENDGDEIDNESIDTSSNMSTTEFAQNFTIKKSTSDEIHNNIPSFSEVSLPPQFTLSLTDELGIFSKILLPKYTQLGPVFGQKIMETDISDDCNMKFIFETCDGGKSSFLSVENKNRSNWLRYIRPAASRDLRNATLIYKNNLIYFVTCSDIEVGCELLYWSDETNSAWDKKKIDRTSKTSF